MKYRRYEDSLKADLRDPEEAAAYLEAAFDEDEEGFLMALRAVAEAHGITNIARQTGLGRESLYKSLSANGNPRLSTLRALLDAIGVRMCFASKGTKTRLVANH